MTAGQDAVSQAVQEFKTNGESSAFQKQLTTIWSSENKDPQKLASDLKSIQTQTGRQTVPPATSATGLLQSAGRAARWREGCRHPDPRGRRQNREPPAAKPGDWPQNQLPDPGPTVAR